jgi:hypothetical protein
MGAEESLEKMVPAELAWTVSQTHVLIAKFHSSINSTSPFSYLIFIDNLFILTMTTCKVMKAGYHLT